MTIHTSTQHPSEMQHLVAAHAQRPGRRRHRRGAAHGRRIRRQGNAGRAMGGDRGARRTRHRQAVQDPARPRRRHVPDRQAARFPRPTTKSASTSKAASTALDTVMASRCGYSADVSGAINDRAMFHADNAYYLPAATITTKRMKTNTVSNTAFRGFGGPQGMMVAERAIDEIAWALGHRSARRAQAQSLWRRPRRDALRHAGRGQHPARADRALRGDVRLSRAAARDRGVQRGQRDAQARPCADAGEVRHLVHHHASQSGRRAGARLSGRLDPPEPRRHRDGAGALHQGRAGGGGGVRRRSRAREDHRDHHREGAEHLGDRGLVRLRHQRQGGEERGRRDQGSG